MTTLAWRASRRVFVASRRQRVLGTCSANHHVSFPAERHFSWAPAAYRAPRAPGANKHRHGNHNKRRGGGKKMARGRDGIWQELLQIYDNTSESSSPKQQDEESWKRRRDYQRQDQLAQANQEFRALIHRYRNTLFPNQSSSLSKTKGSVLKLLQQLHDLHNNDDDDDVVSMETIAATEDSFRDIGTLTKTLISLYARMQHTDNNDEKDKNSAMAEQLLWGLIQLQQDRQALVQRAQEKQADLLKEQQESETQKMSGVLGWIKGVFVPSPSEETDTDITENDDNSNKKQETLQTVLVHEEAAFGPTKRQYSQVMKSLKRDLYAHTWHVSDTVSSIVDARIESAEVREAQLLIANKMSALLQLHLQHGGAPSTTLTFPILLAYSQVGSLYAADEARRVYIGPCQRKIPQEGFHSVLRAYSLAALMEETHEARAKAATTATSLLKDREEASGATSYNRNYDGGKDPRGESYTIVLQTLLRAGARAVPNRTLQAEALLKRYLGEKTFDQVVGNRKGKPSSKVDISIFESLLFLYEHAVRNGYMDYTKYLDTMKSIIESAQAQQEAILGKAKSESNDQEQPIFPSTKSYNSLFSAMNARVGVLYSDLMQTKGTEAKKKSIRQEIQQHVDYATSMLDRMTSTSPPDLLTFELLLDILAKSDSSEGEERAQEIMSRMSIRQACTGTSNSSNAWSDSSRVYSNLLRCWAVGPDESSTCGNLHRSLRILDKMEAESGIQYLPGSNVSDAEQEIFDSVYEQNEMESYKNTYNGALKICSNCEEDSQVAFDTAFDIYNRMIAANVAPDAETFEHLFATCLLPGDDKEALQRRRDLAGTVIAFASDHGMETKDMHKQLRSITNKSSKTKRKPKRKAKS